MKTESLFKVLVLGGMLITAPQAHADTEVQTQRDAEVILEELLEAEPIPGLLAFCSADDETLCVENEEGDLVPKAGIVCCWSTSCDA